MSNFLIRKILNKEDLNNINGLVEIANTKNLWSDGILTNRSANHELKNNLELSDFDILNQINSIIMESIDKDNNFFNFVLPAKSFLPIISKTQKGGYYKTHTDSYRVGDYSTTVFLNDTNEYDGGELCLFVGNKEQKIKLEPGYAITYPTNTPHRVSTVTRGVRYVSVLWTESMIKDPDIRTCCGQLRKMLNILTEDSKYNDFGQTVEESMDNPRFITETVYHLLLRRFIN